MLMPPMRRWNAILVLLVALTIGAQPFLHNHPAIPDNTPSFPCATCATTTGGVVIDLPDLAVPLPVFADLAGGDTQESDSEPVLAVPSRAPPAA
jgi:hypothetical protein